jgi:hypothetical protein
MYRRNDRELLRIAYGIAKYLHNEERGEVSILDDLAQEAVLCVLETPAQNLQLDMNKMWDTQRNFLARWRERGYKTQLWQVSREAIEEAKVDDDD